MPIYDYKCKCGHTEWVYIQNHKPKRYLKCERCGKKMIKVYGEFNTDIINRTRYSNSMGVNPRQIPEAMRVYPGSEYTLDGRLIVNSRKDKLKKMKQRGLVEFE